MTAYHGTENSSERIKDKNRGRGWGYQHQRKQDRSMVKKSLVTFFPRFPFQVGSFKRQETVQLPP